MMSDVLKNAMLVLYRDSPEILYCLQQIDYSTLNVKFQKELDARIDRDTYNKVEEFLATDDYLNYCTAISEASMSMTVEIAKLLEFVLDKPKGEVN